jgi:HEAT repeat protein
VRGNAIEVLGETKNPVFLQPLLETLEKDSSDFVRAMAAVSLGELGDRKAKDALKRALKDRKNAADERIVRNAKSALKN